MLLLIAPRIAQKTSAVKFDSLEKLTPVTARIALKMQYGAAQSTGIVIDPQAQYGYHIYEKSARKVKV